MKQKLKKINEQATFSHASCKQRRKSWTCHCLMPIVQRRLAHSAVLLLNWLVTISYIRQETKLVQGSIFYAKKTRNAISKQFKLKINLENTIGALSSSLSTLEIGFKCNVDTVVFTGDQKISMWAVLLDGDGQFVEAMRDVLRTSMTPVESETLGLLQGLNRILTLDHQKVIFEPNRKMLVDYVHSNNG